MAAVTKDRESRLLTLPFEIRERIYTYLFESASTEICDISCGNHPRHGPLQHLHTTVWVPRSQYCHPSILAASRQFHSEARPFLARSLHLKFIIWPFYACAVPRNVRTTCLPLVRHIPIAQSFNRSIPDIDMSHYPSLQLLDVGGMLVSDGGPDARPRLRLQWFETCPVILLFDHDAGIDASDYLTTEPDEALIDQWMIEQHLICSGKDRSERSLLREFWKPDRGYNIAFTISFECHFSWTRDRDDDTWPCGQAYLKFDVDTRELLHRRLMYNTYKPPPHHASNEELPTLLRHDNLHHHYVGLDANNPEWHSGSIDFEGPGYDRPGFGPHRYFDPRRDYPGYAEQAVFCQVCQFYCYPGGC